VNTIAASTEASDRKLKGRPLNQGGYPARGAGACARMVRNAADPQFWRVDRARSPPRGSVSDPALCSRDSFLRISASPGRHFDIRDTRRTSRDASVYKTDSGDGAAADAFLHLPSVDAKVNLRPALSRLDGTTGVASADVLVHSRLRADVVKEAPLIAHRLASG